MLYFGIAEIVFCTYFYLIVLFVRIRRKRMFDRQSIHIALLLWGCIFCLIAALCMFMSNNFDREKRKWLLCMQLSGAVLLCSDAFAWAFRGYPGTVGYLVVRISNFLVFLFGNVMLITYHGYVCSYLFTPEERKNHTARIRLVYLIAVFGMLLVIVSQFTDLYYYIDAQNFYHRNPAYPISSLIPLCGAAIELISLVQYRHNVSRQIFVSLMSYLILPVVTIIVQIFYYGMSLINISISISIILMFVSAMAEQNRELAKREEEAAELRVSLMLSQIKPHFIYNTLTTIQRLCVKDPKMAQETVGEFATYLRGNLGALDRKTPIPFESELEHVRCYLAIEQKRFGDRVRVDYDIGEKDFMIPALTLQPIVENAVKHGLCKKDEGGLVRIRTERKAGTVYITVTDNGVGFDPDRIAKDGKIHIGINNVRDRLRNMCGGTLTIESSPGKGTIAMIALPQ